MKRITLMTLGLLLIAVGVSIPFVARGDHRLVCTLTVAQNASGSCQLSGLRKYDMQCDQAPVRCVTGDSAVAAVATDFKCIASVNDTYPVDPRGHNLYVAIRPEAAGNTTCRVYWVAP